MGTTAARAAQGARLLNPGDCTVLTGDTDVDTPAGLLTAGPTGAQAITTQDGGKVTMEADGNFTFFPAAGTSCTDTTDQFDYTLSDNEPVNPRTDTGTVFLTITDCVWYVDESLATNGDGSATSPFNSLAPSRAPAAPATPTMSMTTSSSSERALTRAASRSRPTRGSSANGTG